jgi:EmrB/QacA subfamily drug resistance transporter
VNLSGGPSIAPFEELPRRLKEDFSFAFQCDDPGEIQSAFDDLELDLTRHPTASVLSIHGARDDIFPLAGIDAVDEAWGDRHELVVYPSEAHVCLNEINLVTLQAADWMTQALCAEEGPGEDESGNPLPHATSAPESLDPEPLGPAPLIGPEPSEPEPVAASPDGARDAGAIPSRVWLIAFVIVIGAFMTQLDASMVNIVLAPLTRELHSTLGTTQWIVTAYMLGLVVGLPLAGAWARSLGAGRLWLASLGAFVLGSAACAGAPTAGVLIAARVLQGLAGGVMLPAGQTVIAQAAGKERLGRVMSVVGTALVLAPALGPIVGAETLIHLSWPCLFLVNIPVGAVALWLGLRVIPRGDRARQHARFDLLGFVLVGSSLPLITYAISRSWQYGAVDVGASVWPFALGMAALVAFTWHCWRAPTPLLRIRLFSNARFFASALLSFLVGLAEFGALVAWPLYFLVIGRFTLVHTGAAMLGFAAGSSALPISGRLTDRYGGGRVCLVGSAVLAAGYVLAASVIGRHAPFLALEASLLMLGIGTSFTVVPTLTTAFVAVRPPDVGDAVAIVNIMLRVGGVVGITLAVAVIGNQTTQRTARLVPFQHAFTMMAVIAAVCGLGAAVLIAVSRARRAGGEG